MLALTIQPYLHYNKKLTRDRPKENNDDMYLTFTNHYLELYSTIGTQNPGTALEYFRVQRAKISR